MFLTSEVKEIFIFIISKTTKRNNIRFFFFTRQIFTWKILFQLNSSTVNFHRDGLWLDTF